VLRPYDTLVAHCAQECRAWLRPFGLYRPPRAGAPWAQVPYGMRSAIPGRAMNPGRTYVGERAL